MTTLAWPDSTSKAFCFEDVGLPIALIWLDDGGPETSRLYAEGERTPRYLRRPDYGNVGNVWRRRVKEWTRAWA